MSGKEPSAGAEEMILKYQKIVQMSKEVSLASLNLIQKMEALVQDPGVDNDAIADYWTVLMKLMRAEEVMMNRLYTQMMEDFVPIGAEAMRVLVMEGAGKCTCGREGH